MDLYTHIEFLLLDILDKTPSIYYSFFTIALGIIIYSIKECISRGLTFKVPLIGLNFSFGLKITLIFLNLEFKSSINSLIVLDCP